MKKHAITLIAAAMLFGISDADAAQRISFCGPVSKVGPMRCLSVKNMQWGHGTYDISSALPRPAVGTQIQGSGVLEGVSICFGRHLAKVAWRRVRFCPI